LRLHNFLVVDELAIKIENLSKVYRLGVVGASTLRDDFQRLWWKMRGKGDPLLKIGEENTLNKRSDRQVVWALRDINLEVKKGEILGIIGKNGAGKSTLLKILSRVTLPTKGIIKIRGKLGSLLEVGTGFHPELTGRENIYLNGAILGMTRQEISKKLDDIVDFAGVAKYIDTPVKRYSSGMFVRLGFAVAAFLEPDILVVDEVLAVGDAEFQKRAVGKMKEVSRKGGRTVLFVSHNMGSVKNLCTRAILLEKGKIVKDDVPENTVNFYLKNIQSAVSQDFVPIENEHIKITSIEFVDCEKLEKTNIFYPGKNYKIKIYYATKQEIRNVIVRLIFYNSYGELLFVCDNYISSEIFIKVSNEGFFECEINNVPLNEGNYFFSLSIYKNMNELFLYKENAYSFSVYSFDFFGTGKLPAIKRGVLVKHKWAIR